MFVASPAVSEVVDLPLLSTKYDLHTIDNTLYYELMYSYNYPK